MIHRALKQGEAYLSNAQLRPAGQGSNLGNDVGWNSVSIREGDEDAINPEYNAGAFKTSDKWIALNRPIAEDDPRLVNEVVLDELFAGLDYRVIKESVGPPHLDYTRTPSPF